MKFSKLVAFASFLYPYLLLSSFISILVTTWLYSYGLAAFTYVFYFKLATSGVFVIHHYQKLTAYYAFIKNVGLNWRTLCMLPLIFDLIVFIMLCIIASHAS